MNKKVVGALSVLAALAALSFAVSPAPFSPKKTAQLKQEAYGIYLQDHDFCMKMGAAYKKPLAEQNRTKLETLAHTDHQVGMEALVALTRRANKDEVERSKLAHLVPSLLTSPSATNKERGVLLIKWFKFAGYRGQLESMKKSLDARNELGQNELFLQETIAGALGTQGI